MNKRILLLFMLICAISYAQEKKSFTEAMALKLSEMPLGCISQEYPNKTGHIYNDSTEVVLSPKDLHPSFYGCFDWHSSVHGHWMLIRILKQFPNIENAQSIIKELDNSFQAEKLQEEANYFSKYDLANHFERTYGWAWVLKLDEDLLKSDLPEAKKWHKNIKPLTDTIVKLWKKYLPKQTYPNRTGVHPNSAFALGFALDWARAVNDKEFERELIEKSISFYGNDINTPAYLEPDGADFFSPSLQIAYLMSRIYSKDEFTIWFDKFIDNRGLNKIAEIPIVSDLSDYQTVHLVGLSFSRAWCMSAIAEKLAQNHEKKAFLNKESRNLTEKALPLLFKGNYGGGHWLASFAIYALSKYD